MNAGIEMGPLKDRAIGVARGKQKFQAGLAHPGALRQIPARQTARHDHVTEHEIEGGIGRDGRKGLAAVGGFAHPITKILKHQGNGAADHRLVFDQ